MDRISTHPTAIPRRPSLANNAMPLNSSKQQYQLANVHPRPQYPTTPPATDDGQVEASAATLDRSRLKELNCERRRPEEEAEDKSRLSNMPSALVNQTVTPFLKEHVPTLYAPISKLETANALSTTEPSVHSWNSKYCYRHRPDSKCRKAADEDKMAMIQTVSCCCCSCACDLP